MRTVLTYGLVFSGGVAVGLYLAKLYAKSEATSTIHSVLNSVGFGGGVVETITDRLVTPSLS
jgi:hypothetical protein